MNDIQQAFTYISGIVHGAMGQDEEAKRCLLILNKALGSATFVPAVSIEESVTPNYLICLEDGKHLKTMKRYLKVRYNLSPDEYRRKWGLPATYPMVAPNHSQRRSEIAKVMGLGTMSNKKRAA